MSKALLDLSHKLKSVLDSPEYQETIGKWLDEIWKANLDTLLHAESDTNYFKAQGACIVVNFLRERSSTLLAQGEAVRLKLWKEEQKNVGK